MAGRDSYPGAGPFLPGAPATLADLAAAVQNCHGCNLYQGATQAVFGRGPQTAAMVLIGEGPGDAEDKAGDPFVGPSGRVLDRALAEARIDRASLYTTSVIRHFSWKPDPRGGRRRLHQRPSAAQLRACRPWLLAELARLDPAVIVTAGAIAGQALLGAAFRVSTARGSVITWSAPLTAGGRDVTVVPTVDPAAVLRADDRDAAFTALVADLRTAAGQARLR
jgi:uracil-DNA glycosylase